MIQIDKNVPICGHSEWPFVLMEVGDSFLIPTGAIKHPLQVAYQGNLKHAPKRFISRRVEGGTRVWRIA